MKNAVSKSLMVVITVVVVSIFGSSCKKYNIKETTTDDVNMVGYF